ncbi:MAG: Thymidylate kinase [Candidatus Magasanikbacteria bacterium GW2011_GWA2_56_11]|uniref:Thymidylate kinase n=1 Tax=Candidatus Magasanikbacteria bacterium GW2011_GWA2_56_11 TaxID=1619044 RepID=A0A0G1YHJ4_9BACT|nr:MAG: Thymidylate kinase [Candidatus Magasanikbacteria bacterium GW2011_GWA2_56_11]
MPQGFFITIDGTDGSGKTTQTELLVERLRQAGYAVETISFPRYGERSAAMVEDYLNGAFGSAEDVGPYRASIFYAIDRYAASTTIRRWLDEGKIVVSNRYVGASLGHQGGKISTPEERNRYFTWVYDLEYNIFGIPKPDVNIVLHVTPEISQKLVDEKDARAYLHGKSRDIHEDDLGHLARAEATYLEISRLFCQFHVIECVSDGRLRAIQDIHNQIFAYAEEQIRSHPTP